MKIVYSVLLLFITVSTFCQSNAKTKEPHIIRTASYRDLKSVTFPTNYISGEKNGLKLFYCNDSAASYQAMVYLTTKFPDVNKQNFSSKLDTTANGYFSAFKFQDNTKVSRDTTINNIRGRFLYGKFQKNQGINLASVYAFVTVFNKSLYFFQVFTKNDDGYDINSIKSFFRSVQFTGNQFTK
jgi:hypothetical protein